MLKEIINFFDQKWLPNIIGMVGGMAGLWSFIDNYLVKFKPKIFIGTKVFIEIKENQKSTALNSMICSLEVCNHRKKYGVIYDFAIRIYKADEINPSVNIYYASQTIDVIPSDKNKLDQLERKLFNPITILPNSNKSINIILSEVLTSKMDMLSFNNYYIETYYQKTPKDKWHFVNKSYLYDLGEAFENRAKHIEFTVINSHTTREKLNKNVRLQRTDLYLGVTHKYLLDKMRLLKYWVLTKPLNVFKDLFISTPFYFHFLANKSFEFLVKIPIIKREGKRIKPVKITVGSPALKPVTNSAFDQIVLQLQKLIEQINDGAEQQAKISIKKEDDKIIISRNRLSIQIYISGDTSIRVQESRTNITSSKLSYKLDLRIGPWSYYYWYLENHGFILLKSFAIKLLDAFIIHSSY